VRRQRQVGVRGREDHRVGGLSERLLEGRERAIDQLELGHVEAALGPLRELGRLEGEPSEVGGADLEVFAGVAPGKVGLLVGYGHGLYAVLVVPTDALDLGTVNRVAWRDGEGKRVEGGKKAVSGRVGTQGAAVGASQHY
jgi:hypothetical protein